MVHVHFSFTQKFEYDYKALNKTKQKRKVNFEPLREAFARHWLGGFPLWDSKNNSKKRRNQIVAHYAGKGLETPTKGLLRHWMNFLRQAAALWRIEPSEFEALTRPFVETFIAS
jgi:hypothetical protein